MIQKLVVEAKEAVHRALKDEVKGGDDRALRLLEDFEIASEAMGLGMQDTHGAGASGGKVRKGEAGGATPGAHAASTGAAGAVVEHAKSHGGVQIAAIAEGTDESDATQPPHPEKSKSPDARESGGADSTEAAAGPRISRSSLPASEGGGSADHSMSSPETGPMHARDLSGRKAGVAMGRVDSFGSKPDHQTAHVSSNSGMTGSVDSFPHSSVHKVIGAGLRGGVPGRIDAEVGTKRPDEGTRSASRADRSPKSTGRASTSATDTALLWHDDESEHARIVDGGREAGGMSMSVLSRLLFLMGRWWRLSRDLHDRKKKKWNLSKLADVYDNCKFDCQHNRDLGLKRVEDVFQLAVSFADCIIPQEYGVTTLEKSMVGCRIVHHLLRKIFFDLTVHKQSWEVREGGKKGALMPDHDHATASRSSPPSAHGIGDGERAWTAFRSSLAQAKHRVKQSALMTTATVDLAAPAGTSLPAAPSPIVHGDASGDGEHPAD